MVVCAIQSEWIFLQSVTKYMGHSSVGVENLLRETFLTHILFGKSKTLSPVEGDLSTFPAKKSRKGLHNPVKSAEKKYTSFLPAICKLIVAVTDERGFQPSTTFRRLKRNVGAGKIRMS